MDVRQRFMNGYFLNANSLTQRYLRRVYNISAGLRYPLCPQTGVDFADRHNPLEWHQGMFLGRRTPAICPSILPSCLGVS